MAADPGRFPSSRQRRILVKETITCIYLFGEFYSLFAFPPQVYQQFFVKPLGCLPLISAETDMTLKSQATSQDNHLLTCCAVGVSRFIISTVCWDPHDLDAKTNFIVICNFIARVSF